MVAGRKRASPAGPAAAGKKTKQTSIAVSMQARAPAAQLVVEVAAVAAPPLGHSLGQELEMCGDRYQKDWGLKCIQQSNLEAGGAARHDVNLDGRGMAAVAAFAHAARLAAARGAVVDPAALELLVLIMRNDSVHSRSHVSRAAHAALSAHLAARPYARLGRHPEGEGPYAGCPYVITDRSSAWVPLQQ